MYVETHRDWQAGLSRLFVVECYVLLPERERGSDLSCAVLTQPYDSVSFQTTTDESSMSVVNIYIPGRGIVGICWGWRVTGWRACSVENGSRPDANDARTFGFETGIIVKVTRDTFCITGSSEMIGCSRRWRQQGCDAVMVRIRFFRDMALRQWG